MRAPSRSTAKRSTHATTTCCSGCDGGWAWFGLRHDGANVGQGHTLTLPCDGAPVSVEFQFSITGNPNGGVPSMIAGDEIHVVYMDADENPITTATANQRKYARACASCHSGLPSPLTNCT